MPERGYLGLTAAGGRVLERRHPHLGRRAVRAQDARTGDERGSLVLPTGIRGMLALGDGRVRAVDREGAHRVVG